MGVGPPRGLALDLGRRLSGVVMAHASQVRLAAETWRIPTLVGGSASMTARLSMILACPAAYAHAGDLSLFVRDEARALAELDAVARAGYHGVRVWSASVRRVRGVLRWTRGRAALARREVGPS
jgi:hypothetical protein